MLTRRTGRKPQPHQVITKETITSRVKHEGECWIWTAHIAYNGTGRLCLNRKQYQAHRLSKHLFEGFDLTSTDVVESSCGRKNCVRPEHLIVISMGNLLKKRWAAKRQPRLENL